jgi:2-polyprenyl-3-methyl-5-hydroxy-6-metoxy-1,4-benzoquinol methylase
MARVLTVDQPCRLELECPDGVPAPEPASQALLRYMFSVREKSVLHLGCGCGLFAIAAAKLGAGEVWAVDPSPAAVDCTRRNAERNGVKVVAKAGDLFEAVEGRTFDLIVTLPAKESILRLAPDHLEDGGELLTGLTDLSAAGRFESLLSGGFKFRALPKTPVDGVSFLLPYLAMKR